MPESRSVKEIQAELMSAAEAIKSTFRRLRLGELMTELERNYPADLDGERVGEGEICPPAAWEIHADVGNAKILLEEVIQSLERASRRTEGEVRREWLEEKLKEIGDPPAQALLGFFVGTLVDEDDSEAPSIDDGYR